VTEFLGRERYALGGRVRADSRIGHCPITIKTTSGPVTLDRPKLRVTEGRVRSPRVRPETTPVQAFRA
jgi:hypothetical protein